MRHCVRDHVCTRATEADDHGALSYPDKLAYGYGTAEYNMISNTHMAGKKHVVRKHHVAADLAIMCHMGTDHEKTPVTDFRYAATVLGAGIHRNVLTDIAIGAHHQPGRPATIADRLWRRAK